MNLKTFIEESKERFRKKFPYIPHNDNFGADGSVTGGSDIRAEVESYFESELKKAYTEGESYGRNDEAVKCDEHCKLARADERDKIIRKNLKGERSRVLHMIREEERLAFFELVEGTKKHGEDKGISSTDSVNLKRHLMYQHIESWNAALDEILNKLK